MLFFMSVDKPEYEYSGKIRGNSIRTYLPEDPGSCFVPEGWHRIFCSGQLATVLRRNAYLSGVEPLRKIIATGVFIIKKDSNGVDEEMTKPAARKTA